MRPPSFDSSTLRSHLLVHRIADLPALMRVLGTNTPLTVFRKLQPLDPVTSYTHSGRFHTLAEIARFDTHGLWSHQSVWFSRHGTLRATVEHLVRGSAAGYFARELAGIVHTGVQQPLRELVQQNRLSRAEVDGQFLYTSAESGARRQQTLSRSTALALPVIAQAPDLEISPEELRAAIVLFYATLDEQQRRLYAGTESLRLGRGCDKLIAEFLHLDPHTVARGRQQLLDGEILTGRARHPGGGRPPQEKKRPK